MSKSITVPSVAYVHTDDIDPEKHLRLLPFGPVSWRRDSAMRTEMRHKSRARPPIWLLSSSPARRSRSSLQQRPPSFRLRPASRPNGSSQQRCQTTQSLPIGYWVEPPDAVRSIEPVTLPRVNGFRSITMYDPRFQLHSTRDQSLCDRRSHTRTDAGCRRRRDALHPGHITVQEQRVELVAESQADRFMRTYLAGDDIVEQKRAPPPVARDR
jgi:hypothetical protein